MESLPTFPSNKRYAMHFKHQTPIDNFITARFPNPKTAHLSPSNVSIATYHTPEGFKEALALSQSPPPPPPPPPHASKSPSPARQPLTRSQSSSWWMEIRKSPTPKQQGPRSRKTGEATIRTEATENEPAFESDAFAVHMPTTREPILDAPVFRAKLPSPSKAQVEAYHTYKHKADLARERQQVQGVQVPSKLISYDYAFANAAREYQSVELDESSPPSPTDFAPAGSFPASPPILQHGWAKPAPRLHGPRAMSEGTHLFNPSPTGNVRANNSPPRYYQRTANAETGTSRSTPTPSPKPSTITVRLKPKGSVPGPVTDRPQEESKWGLYNRSPQSSSNGSRSPSPTKPNFLYTTTANDTVFGYGSKNINGTVADVSKTPQTSPTKLPKTATKEKATGRWAWLRPVGPRAAKPTGTQTIHTPVAAAKTTAYIDPFVLHASPVPSKPTTPSSSRPASPKKPIHSLPPQNIDKSTFETGFAQIKSLTSLLLKLCLLIYALVGLYFLLDAIRQVVSMMGAPFRGMKVVMSWCWIGVVWLAKLGVKGWERFGENVSWD